MTIRQPLTIEIFGLKDGTPVVLDRVIGGSVFVKQSGLAIVYFLSLIRKHDPRVFVSSARITN